ncbi:MAG: hypothetical protein AAFO07_11655, partial [Bacteroidota bacterium]
MKKWLAFTAVLLVYACSTTKGLYPLDVEPDWKVKEIPAEPQAEGGDPEKGFDYLKYGSYVGSGLPYPMVKKVINRGNNVLEREGLNENVFYAASVFPGK